MRPALFGIYRLVQRMLAAALLLAGVAGSVALSAELTAEEERGKQIYLKGTSPSGGRIYAYVGRDRVKVPAGAVPCGNCHGEDGLGRPEGGVLPPDITWPNLTKSYGHRHEDGRSHPPFDKPTLATSIRGGIDSAFNKMKPTMPLYEMPDEDMEALVAYMMRLGEDMDPGVDADMLRVATMAPGDGQFAAMGEAIVAVLRAYFADINAAGGIYGRKIEVLVAERGATSEQTLDRLEKLLDEEKVFAFVGGFAVGLEHDFFDILRRRGMPNVGPATLLPVPPNHGDGGAFLTGAGIAEQARVLVRYAATEMDPAAGSVAVLYSEVADAETVIDAVRLEARRQSLPEPQVMQLGVSGLGMAKIVEELSGAGVDAIFFFGTEQHLLELAGQVESTAWRPRIMLSGPLNSRTTGRLSDVFDGRVLLAYPNLPADASAAGIEELRRLRAAYDLPDGHLAAQISTLVSAKVLVEGLRRSGKALSRKGLVGALEDLYNFDSGLTRPISFGPARHVGMMGAHVVVMDRKSKTSDAAPLWLQID